MKSAAFGAAVFLAIGAALFWVYAAYILKPVGTSRDMQMQHGTMNAEIDPASSSTIALWRARIRSDGAEKAYKEFATANAKLDPGESHMQAHLFGAALYAEKGDDGFPTCGSLFQYGCAHALIAAAMSKEGEAVVAKFSDACRATAWPQMCLHGIGHGLIRTFGTSDTDAQKAMRICIDTVGDSSTAGCVGGVIMEYDGQSMMGMSGGERTMTVKNTYEPCFFAPDKAKSACYYWIVSWWYDSLVAKKVFSMDIFKRLGSLCRSLPEAQFSSQCYAGMGAMAAAASGYTGPAAGAFCDGASENATARMYCRAYAANILLEGEPGSVEISKNLCSIEGIPLERCERLARKGVAALD